MLHLRQFGSGPEVVALHGFSLTGEHFEPASDLLDRTIVAPDLPGHGSSDAVPTNIDSVLAQVEAILATPGGPRPLIGYSQGARIALLAAVADPSHISALVLISGTAGIRDRDARHARVMADIEWAESIELIGLDAFLDSWTTAGIASVRHLSKEYRTWDRAVRSENSAAGLAAALRGYGQGAQPSAWEEIDGLRLPVLLITGSRDEQYTALNEEMAGLIPHAELVVVSDSGHDPLADQPEATYEAISSFLDRNS